MDINQILRITDKNIDEAYVTITYHPTDNKDTTGEYMRRYVLKQEENMNAEPQYYTMVQNITG